VSASMGASQITVSMGAYLHLAKLRLLVGYLGEKDQADWWDCRFLCPNGIRFLEINFPRTVLAAGITSVTAAARRFHDERIGKKNVYHLFRLPAALEEAVHNSIPPGVPEDWASIITDVDTAVSKLGEMSDDVVDAPVGPVQVGTSETLATDAAVIEIAKHYHDAFTHEKVVLPYFSGGQA
jgi:hypothetical protein